MPEDKTRVTYDENGGKVTEIPKGTPKQEIARRRRANNNRPRKQVDVTEEVTK